MSDFPTTLASDGPQAVAPKGMHRPQPIIFTCPNGHRIVVDAALAGKKGRCKECKEIVTIPSPASFSPQRGAQAGQPKPAAMPQQTVVEKSDTPQAAVTGPEDGSRALHREPTDGPSLIINEPAPPHRQSPAGPAKTVIGPPLLEGESSLLGPSIDPNEVQINFGNDVLPAGQPPQMERAEGEPELLNDGEGVAVTLVNPTARLMERLWYERRHGGVIEVHLTGAVSPILPTYFYPGWSDGSHGLFASLAADGTVTLTAVAWESVQKIVVRHVDSIPPDFLDIGLDE